MVVSTVIKIQFGEWTHCHRYMAIFNLDVTWPSHTFFFWKIDGEQICLESTKNWKLPWTVCLTKERISLCPVTDPHSIFPGLDGRCSGTRCFLILISLWIITFKSLSLFGYWCLIKNSTYPFLQASLAVILKFSTEPISCLLVNPSANSSLSLIPAFVQPLHCVQCIPTINK